MFGPLVSAKYSVCNTGQKFESSLRQLLLGIGKSQAYTY